MPRLLTVRTMLVLVVVLSFAEHGATQNLDLFSESPNDLGGPFDAIRSDISTVPPEDISKRQEVPGAVTPAVLFDFRVRAVVDAMYDTGVVGSGALFYPSTIVLDGTTAQRGQGQFRMFGGTSSLAFAFGAPRLPGEPGGMAELDFVGDAIDRGPGGATDLGFVGSGVRFLRAYGTAGISPNSEILGGQDWTTFGDFKARPFSVINDGCPSGAVFRRQALLRYTTQHDHGFSHAVAIEDPTNTDFLLPDPPTVADPDRDVRLRRWPDFAAYWRWVRPGDPWGIDRAQIATLVRGIGYEDLARSEHFIAGWGVAGTARFRVHGDNNVQLGAVGGEGLGRYLFGFGADSSVRDVTAACPDVTGRLIPLPTVGAYLGYQQYWTSRLVSNVAYGWAHVDTTAAMSDDVARTTQNAWTNVVFEVRKDFFVGVEYQYGLLEVNDDRCGHNHRVQLTLAYRTPK